MDEEMMIVITSSLIGIYCLLGVAFKIVWPWRGEAKGLLAQCCNRLRCKSLAPDLSPEDEEVERRVREERLKRHVQRAVTFMVLFGLFNSYYSISTLWSVAVGRPTMPIRVLVIIQVNQVIKATLAFFPKLLTPKVIDVVYIETVVHLTLSVTVAPQSLVSHRILRLMQMFFWGLFDLKPWLNTAGVLCLMLAELPAAIQQGVPVQDLIPSWGAFLSSLLALKGIDYCLELSVRFEILATDSKRELTAVQTLLNSICDVVVMLDSQLRLKQHSPKLAGVLLQSATRNLAGVDLRDLMATNEDRERFAEHVCLKGESTAQADVFHARLRDSTRGGVAMEFFTVGYKNHDGGEHHIIGMREHTDIQPLAIQQPEPPPPPVEVVMTPRSPGHGRRHAEGRDQPQLGTPSSAQHWDLRSLRSSSASGSERARSDDEASSSSSDFSIEVGSPGVGNLGAQDLVVVPGVRVPVMVTSEIAKIVSTNYMLMSWVTGSAHTSCCPKHAALACLRQIATKLAEQDCMMEYGPNTDWQCQRCGIMADEHRDPKHMSGKKCLLCKRLVDAHFQPGAGMGIVAGAAL